MSRTVVASRAKADGLILAVKRHIKRLVGKWWAGRIIVPGPPGPAGGGRRAAPALAPSPARPRPVTDHDATWVGFHGGRRPTALDGVAVTAGRPDIEVLDAVVWSPEDACLYIDGVRVDASARPFGPPDDRAYPDSRPQVAFEGDLARLDGAFLWAGPLTTHFGHFLLEGIARLWAVDRFPDMPILVTPEDPLQVPSFRTAFLRAAGIGRDRLVAIDRPCVLEQAVVPLPSLVHDGGGHAVHRDLPLRVAEVLDGPAPQPSDRPVHLSRRRLEPARRRAESEAVLERELRRAGFLVASPERLSLRQQIRLWRRHRTFTGQIGSAFHAALLAPPRRRTIVLAREEGVPAHYPTIDALCETDATYVACLRTDPESPKQRTHRDVLLDVDAALEVIRSAGLA